MRNITYSLTAIMFVCFFFCSIVKAEQVKKTLTLMCPSANTITIKNNKYNGTIQICSGGTALADTLTNKVDPNFDLSSAKLWLQIISYRVVTVSYDPINFRIEVDGPNPGCLTCRYVDKKGNRIILKNNNATIAFIPIDKEHMDVKKVYYIGASQSGDTSPINLFVNVEYNPKIR